MSLYNTGNPVPSIDPRDLDDNAKHLDEFVNGTEPTYTDRLGVERKTLSAIESDADSELLRSELAIKVTSKRFEATATDDAGTPDAMYRVVRIHAAATSPHAFRDQTKFTPSAAGVAICSYDGAILSNGANNIDHEISFQSRINHTGTGTVSKLYGSGSFNIIDGPVTSIYGMYAGDRVNSASGGCYGIYNRPALYANVVNSYGLVHSPAANAGCILNNSIGVRIETVDGAGSVTNEYGIYIKGLSKGTNKFPIYIEATTGTNYIAALTQIDQTLQVGGNAKLCIGGLTGTDFPAITYNYNPRLDQYITNGEASGIKWASSSIQFRFAPSGTSGAAPSFVNAMTLTRAPTSNNTSMTLLINDGTTTTVKQVSIGAADSGGTGFRILRVPN